MFSILVPEIAPENVKGINTSSTSIMVSWSHIPKEKWHGVLKEYVVRLESVVLNNVEDPHVTEVAVM